MVRASRLLIAAIAVALLLATRLQAGDISAAIDTIRAADLQAHIEVLADDALEGRRAGYRGGYAAADYIVEQLKKLGIAGAGDDGGYFQPFQDAYRNVLAVIPGSDPILKDQYILVGAHYDHVGYGTRKTSRGPIGYVHNGADDNASGVAGLLEIIEALKSLDKPLPRSLLFAFWDAEEIGLLGSKHWIADPIVPIHQVVFAIHCDMIGRLHDKGLKVFGTRTARGIRRLLAMQNGDSDLPIDFTWDLKANSDHYPFYANRIPVLLFHTGLHDDYHRPSDDADRINSEGEQRVTRLVLRLVATIASQPERLAFRQQSQNESQADHRRLEQPLPPTPPRLGVAWRHPENANAGLLLTHVYPGSPADEAGLKPGDHLLRFAGREVSDDDALRRQVLVAPSSTTAVIERDDQTPVTLTLRLPGHPLRLGVSWREDEAEPGVLVLSRVIPDSPADLAGVQVGDRIYQLNGQDFSDGTDFQQQVANSGYSVRLLLERDGRLRSVVVPMLPRESASGVH